MNYFLIHIVKEKSLHTASKSTYSIIFMLSMLITFITKMFLSDLSSNHSVEC